MSSIIRFHLLNLLLIGVLTACGGGGDNPTFSSTGGAKGSGDGSSGSSGSGGTDTGGSSGSSGTGGGGSSGTGGGGSSGTGGSDGGPTCADLNCTAPATCDSTVATPRCVCPPGYEDVAGDGSNCRDIDECAAAGDAGADAGTPRHDCHANATCTNTPGSFTCTCNAPAYTGDGKTCTCATGYTAVADKCLKDNAGPCTAGTECASGNCVGGACCQLPCNTPTQCEKQDGTVCVNGTTCRYGLQADDSPCDDGDGCTNTSCFDGQCTVDPDDPGKDCADTNACTTDSCTPGTGACVHTQINPAVTCNDNNPCTRDSCNRNIGCQNTPNNNATCTDNNPCTDDICSGGVCVSTPKVCASTDCTTGTCNNGTCGSTPTNVNGSCDEGLNACSATGRCSAAGACTPQNDACGALAASCVTCTGTANCYQGRRCTCRPPAAGAPPNIVVNGVCVPDTNECATNPCDQNPVATCVDPTPNGSVNGDVRCTCPAGYTGTGLGANGCIDIDECNGMNPCGPGVAPGGCNGLSPPGSYSCTCAAGYRSMATPSGPTCVCDLAGTYSVIVDTAFSFPPIANGGTQVIEGSPPAGVTVRSWSLRHHTVSANGTVTAKTIPCGGLSPTLCDTALSAAHAQYQSNQVWGRAGMRNDSAFPPVIASLAGVVPGGSYIEPESVSLFGINLASRTGAWPPCWQCVGVAAGAQCTCPGQPAFPVTNTAQWVDSDEDTILGVTTEDVSRGGEPINGTVPDPPIAYTEPSECPRIATPQGTYNYTEWPGLAGGVLFRTYRWYGATRAISSFRGTTVTFSANQCVVSGSLGGPLAGNKPRADARVRDCETCSPINFTTCNPGADCSNAQVDSYDSVSASTVTILSSNFTMRKMPTTDLGAVLALPEGAPKVTQITQMCDELREANCPAGKNCTVP